MTLIEVVDYLMIDQAAVVITNFLYSATRGQLKDESARLTSSFCLSLNAQAGKEGWGRGVNATCVRFIRSV